MPTRNAQLVALIHFMTGKGNEITFSRERHNRLPEPHQQGLAELVAAGMLVKREEQKGKFIIYTSTAAIGCPIRDFEPMKPKESWEF